jgi:hypothetical protein
LRLITFSIWPNVDSAFRVLLGDLILANAPSGTIFGMSELNVLEACFQTLELGVGQPIALARLGSK